MGGGERGPTGSGSDVSRGGNSTTPTGDENSFTPGGGVWLGNYPGATGEVDTTGYVGAISP